MFSDRTYITDDLEALSRCVPSGLTHVLLGDWIVLTEYMAGQGGIRPGGWVLAEFKARHARLAQCGMSLADGHRDPGHDHADGPHDHGSADEPDLRMDTITLDSILTAENERHDVPLKALLVGLRARLWNNTRIELCSTTVAPVPAPNVIERLA